MEPSRSRIIILRVLLLVAAGLTFCWAIHAPYTVEKNGAVALCGALAFLTAVGPRGLKTGWPLPLGLALAVTGWFFLPKIATGLAILLVANLFFTLFFILNGRFRGVNIALFAGVLVLYALYFAFGMAPQIPNVAGALHLSNGAAGAIFFVFFFIAALVPASSLLAERKNQIPFALAGIVTGLFYFILAEGFFGGRLTLEPYFYPVFPVALLCLAGAPLGDFFSDSGKKAS